MRHADGFAVDVNGVITLGEIGEHAVELGRVAKALALAPVATSPVGAHVQKTTLPRVKQAALGGVPDVGEFIGMIDGNGCGDAVDGLDDAFNVLAMSG